MSGTYTTQPYEPVWVRDDCGHLPIPACHTLLDQTRTAGRRLLPWCASLHMQHSCLTTPQHVVQWLMGGGVHTRRVTAARKCSSQLSLSLSLSRSHTHTHTHTHMHTHTHTHAHTPGALNVHCRRPVSIVAMVHSKHAVVLLSPRVQLA